ncbi:MAG: succinylglutamate desuccinylase/aspartoacylase family protein [Planctomycetota bacterium]
MSVKDANEVTMDAVECNDGERDWSIPVKIFDSGRKGPSFLVQAGIHGGEQTSIEVALRLGELMGERSLVRGRLLIAPFACLPGVLRGSNTWSDVISKNQVWPGKPNGNPKERLYHALAEDLLPRATHVVDLHCFNHYKSTTAFAPVDDPESLELAVAGDLPFTLVQDPEQYSEPRREPGEGDNLPKITTTGHCYSLGKPSVLIEFPGGLVNFPGGAMNRRKPNPGIRALRRMMVKLEMLEPISEDENKPAETTRLRVHEQEPDEAVDTPMHDVRAHSDGLFVQDMDHAVSGDWLEEGQVFGKLFETDQLNALPVKSPATGRLFRVGARCTGGDIHAFAREGTMLAQVIELERPEQQVDLYRSEVSMSGPALK